MHASASQSLAIFNAKLAQASPPPTKAVEWVNGCDQSEFGDQVAARIALAIVPSTFMLRQQSQASVQDDDRAGVYSFKVGRDLRPSIFPVEACSERELYQVLCSSPEACSRNSDSRRSKSRTSTGVALMRDDEQSPRAGQYCSAARLSIARARTKSWKANDMSDSGSSPEHVLVTVVKPKAV